MENAANDLKQALTLLVNDPIRKGEIGRTEDGNTSVIDYQDVLNFRGARMNYFCVLGLMARLEMLRQNPKDAYIYAIQVLKECEGIISLVDKANIMTPGASRINNFSTEMLGSFYVNDLYTTSGNLFGMGGRTASTTTGILIDGNRYEALKRFVYDRQPDGDAGLDTRFDVWFQSSSEYSNYDFTKFLEPAKRQGLGNAYYPEIPIMRLSEIYYIACSEFTKADIISYIKENDIRMVNFMYPAADGRLKTLNFVINDAAYLDAILTCGERVDGSSLFPFIEAGSSDLYVVPRFCTAFIDPFAETTTLSMLCSYFNKDGELLESSPEYTLRKACKAFTDVTGMEFQAMGELEYYVISEDSGLFPATDQRGYHESAPYAKFNDFRTDCMLHIAKAGGQIKYGHSEVGNFTLDGKIYEQNEIEFLPVRADLAADQLMIAKWVIRNLAYQYGYDITFAPKITAGKAGSGLHIHMRIMKDGQNQMLKDGVLSETARKAIAGMTQYIRMCRPMLAYV